MESSNLSKNVDYKALISSLPRHSKIRCVDKSVQLYQYKGFWHHPDFLEGLLSAQHNFKAQPHDILLASFPKTGTTWLKALSFAIATRHKFDISNNPLQIALSHDCVPFLEVDLAKNQLDHKYFRDIMPLLSTHTPYVCLPESVISSGGKIVYVWRDPCDTFVSLWEFKCKVAPEETLHVPMQEEFQQFCDGYAIYGPYWEHVLGYWKASLERPGEVLFLKYEDLKNDTARNVKKLAEFMGYPFTKEEENEGGVEKIVQFCGFEHLSNLEVNKGTSTEKFRTDTYYRIPNELYFRKGKVGDWKNHLTVEMKEQLHQIMVQKLSGSGLTLGN